MNVALIGSVSSSYTALDALIRGGVEITGVLGLDESRAELVSDYRSLRPLADQAGLAFQSFVKIEEPGVTEFLERHPCDLLWVIGLSQLVPDDMISLARHGGVGFHPTRLPRGRGRAPVAWTILLGEPAAVSLFYLAADPDAGDIIAQREVEINIHDYSDDLIQRTNEVLCSVVLDLAPRIRDGNMPRTPQDDSRATYYAKRTKADGLIDWNQSTESIYRLVRAAGRPYPGAFGDVAGRKLTIWRAYPADAEQLTTAPVTAGPGDVLETDPTAGTLVRTGDGGIWLTQCEPCGEDAQGITHAHR